MSSERVYLRDLDIMVGAAKKNFRIYCRPDAKEMLEAHVPNLGGEAIATAKTLDSLKSKVRKFALNNATPKRVERIIHVGCYDAVLLDVEKVPATRSRRRELRLKVLEVKNLEGVVSVIETDPYVVGWTEQTNPFSRKNSQIIAEVLFTKARWEKVSAFLYAREMLDTEELNTYFVNLLRVQWKKHWVIDPVRLDKLNIRKEISQYVAGLKTKVDRGVAKLLAGDSR